MGHLARLQRDYAGRAAFLFVSITDAGHPDPKDSPFALDPALFSAGRAEQARAGVAHYRLGFPALLDEGKRAERAYGAFPQKLVVVGADGNVIYDGGQGASGGASPWDLAEVERHLLAAVRATP